MTVHARYTKEYPVGRLSDTSSLVDTEGLDAEMLEGENVKEVSIAG